MITISQAAEAMAGSYRNCSGEMLISSVSTDTRTIQAGALFFALRGEQFDGHKFIENAMAAGAICCVVAEDAQIPEELPAIVVKDTQIALGHLAAAYRRQFSIPVVGITGSVGKTSTKEMIASVLRQSFETHVTKGNFNNEIGLPLTVFQLNQSHEMMVLEMGMSHFGEISRLTRIAQPELAVITNIGVSHIENLGSREGILQAKLEILEGLQMDGTVIMNGDDEMLWGARGELDCETLYYGMENPNCDLVAKNICTYSDSSTFTCKIEGKEYEFLVRVPGIHHIYNALAAILVGMRHHVPMEEIQKGVRAFTPSGLRQTLIQLPRWQIIRDCYNASPDSMQSGLSVLALTETKGRRVACLGDMLELGEISQGAHEKVGKMVVEYQADGLITVGKAAHDIARGARMAGMDPAGIFEFEDNKTLCQALPKLLKDGDVILVKGSRGMHLEEVVDAMVAMAEE
ncbi:MAG: UDP-N-acetylmuramoyl-tripeptide--D-alanyl-D-alanine ligase [Clostridia bacterium]|nr:UDP-N-acetylmuramoyl-tripeptide--D-alanyl-D-alanine ligase [Clostridia bacterium]